MVSNDIVIDIEDNKEDIEIKIESKQYSNLQTKTVSPTTEIQTITYDSGYDALKEVIVNAVDSNIDPNIASENIKSGVEILGVEGSYAPEYEGSYNVTTNGTLPTANKKMVQNLIINVANDFDKYFNNSLVTYKIPDGVTSLNASFFRGKTNLEEIDLNDLTTVSERCFQGCNKLESVDLSNISTINQYAFENCSKLKSIVFRESGVWLGQYCFSYIGDSFFELNIPNVTGGGQNVFLNCYLLRKITIGGAILSYMFQGCSNLKTLVLNANLSSVASSYASPNDTYYKGTLTQWCNINFSSYNTLGGQNFYIKDDNGDVTYDGVTYKKLTGIQVPNDVTTLKSYVFNGMPVTWVSLHSGITSIGYYALNSSKISEIYLYANQVVTLGNINNIYATSSHNVTIYVPQSLVSSYQTATNWSTLYNNGYITFFGMAE